MSNNVQIKSGDTVNVNVGSKSPNSVSVPKSQSTSISIPSIRSIGRSDANYVHQQMVSSATWTITHNMGKKPSATVVDSSKRVVYGEIRYIDNNTLEITFRSAFKGEAYLN